MRSRRVLVLTVGLCLVGLPRAHAQSGARLASERPAALRTTPLQSAESDSAVSQPQLASPAQTSAGAPASVPRLIRFSGILQNLAGKPISGPADVTFVSSNRWDVMAGVSVGFRGIWVNRANMPDEYRDFPPARTLSDLGAPMQEA